MCLICVDFQLQKMTITDAERAFREMSSTISAEHAREVKEMLRSAEIGKDGKKSGKKPSP